MFFQYRKPVRVKTKTNYKRNMSLFSGNIGTIWGNKICSSKNHGRNDNNSTLSSVRIDYLFS